MSAAPLPTTAGGLLRQARQAQGIHIAALAAAIKVAPRKLEALEADRFDELPDATFTRALAQSVCRSLKIDPGPVLALLPPPNGHRLVQVAQGLKTPFTDGSGRLASVGLVKVNSAMLWIAGFIVAAAVVLYLLPSGWMGLARVPHAAAASEPGGVAATSPEPAGLPAEPAESPAAAASAPAATVAAADEPAASAAEPAASAPAPPIRFETTEAAWIGVTDAGGKSLIGRLVQPGETVDLDGRTPLTLRVGNAQHVRLLVRGEPMDLAKYTRENVARLQITP